MHLLGNSLYIVHNEQITSGNFLLFLTFTEILAPVLTASHTLKIWTLSHTWTHLMHFIHLVKSLIRGSVLSHYFFSYSKLYRFSSILNSLARFCNLQLPFLIQVAQWKLCCESISYKFTSLPYLTFLELVFITIPSDTKLLQPVKKFISALNFYNTNSISTYFI